MVQGQQIAAEWMEENPKWRIQSYRCEPPRAKGTDI